MKPDPKSNKFSNRIREHPKIVESWDPRDDSNPCIWFVEDELLLAESVSPVTPPGSERPTDAGRTIDELLRANRVEPRFVTSLLRDIEPENRAAGVEDVHLVRLAGQDVDLLALINELREHESLRDSPHLVSPNHVLVPAANGDGCPHGPPVQYNGPVPTAPPAGVTGTTFTLIDSGYIWQPNWPANPLDTLLGHHQPPPNAGLWPTAGGGWQHTPPEKPDANTPGTLDALAGHANFVAGVLASRCNQPTITIWNHNGAFVGKDLSHVPTELAVLHSLLLSHSPTTRVIVFVYSFPPFGGVVGQQWASTWKQLTAVNANFVLVAPAGNQSDVARRYPAAFGASGGGYPEVIGVASLDANFDCSQFSNRGTPSDAWVTCSAVGEDVHSTFLYVDMPTEEDPQGAHDFEGNSWATWNGTSFATPKVAAAIANEYISGGGTVQDAWLRLRATGTTTPSGAPFADVGVKFPNL